VAQGAADNWYNCLTREVWSAEKQAWCDTLGELQNETYSLPNYGNVQLTNGEFENEELRYMAKLVNRPGLIAMGDIDGDGEDDAAVLVTMNSGGSGQFVYLASMIQQNDGSYENVASTLLGDRVGVQNLAIEDGQIAVNMITHGPEEPLCCPTMEVTEVYNLRPQLVLVDGDNGMPAPLPDFSARADYRDVDLSRVASQTSLVTADPESLARMVFGVEEPTTEGNFQQSVDVDMANPSQAVVTLTQMNLLDDSVQSIRYRLEFMPEGNQWRLDWVGAQNRCYRGRDPQEWTADLCV
jgi:hypothetical protein